jgi:GTP-binding protein
MEIQQISFVGSFMKEHQCPKDNLPEYAFIGRSNVGKSSLINMLSGRKDIAKVSNTPGKTQSLNFFRCDELWYLVDLPGYGYAKISKKQRAKWEQMIEKYLVTRSTLQVAFVLLDLRHKLQKVDLEFINWLGERHIPFVLVYTKADKLKRTTIEKQSELIESELLQHWHTLPQKFVTSARNKLGKEEILNFIDGLNQKFNN